MILNYILYFCLLGASIASAAVLNDRLGWTALLVILFFTLLSFLHTVILYKTFRYKVRFKNGNFVRGEKIIFNAVFQNKTILPCPHASAEFIVKHTDMPSVSEKWHFDVTPFSTTEYNYEIALSHIGTYTFDLKKIVIYDFLGLFHLTYKNKKLNSVLIQPRIEAVNPGDLRSADSSVQSPLPYAQRRHSDIYSGIREYAPGDPLRMIHWKLTAHIGKYMTRVFESCGNGNLAVLTDLRPPEHTSEDLLSLFDCVVEASLSVAFSAMKAGRSVEVVCSYNGEMKKHSPINQLQFNQMVQFYSTAQYNEKYQIDKFIGEYAQKSGFDNMVIVTANLSHELAVQMTLQKSAKKNIFAVFVSPDATAETAETADNASVVEYLNRNGIGYSVISDSQSLKDKME